MPHTMVEQLEDTSHWSDVLDGKWVQLHFLKIHVMQGLNQMFTFNLSLLPIAMMMKNDDQIFVIDSLGYGVNIDRITAVQLLLDMETNAKLPMSSISNYTCLILSQKCLEREIVG